MKRERRTLGESGEWVKQEEKVMFMFGAKGRKALSNPTRMSPSFGSYSLI